MKYVLTIYTDEAAMAVASPEEIRAHLAGFADFIKGVSEAGILQSGAPLQPTATATTVRVRDGETLVTDGPFAETKEQLAGFFLVECNDLDEAISLAARVPTVAIGSIEVRPLWQEIHNRVQAEPS